MSLLKRRTLLVAQLIGPIEKGDFRAVDFAALEDYEIRKRAEPVMKALGSISSHASQTDRSASY